MLEPEGMGDHDGMLRCQTRRGSASFLMAQEDSLPIADAPDARL